MTENHLTARAPFADLAWDSAPRTAVAVSDRDGLALATVLVRKGQRAAFGSRVRERFGIELPRGPGRVAAAAVAFIHTAPEAWLVTSEEGATTFAESLKEEIGNLAAITDQSSGYAVLRITGQRVRDALAKVLPIDLHERAFACGSVASTSAFHIGATLWRLADADDLPVFEIAVFRSFAGSFWHNLTSSAAEFGLEVRAQR